MNKQEPSYLDAEQQSVPAGQPSSEQLQQAGTGTDEHADMLNPHAINDPEPELAQTENTSHVQLDVTATSSTASAVSEAAPLPQPGLAVWPPVYERPVPDWRFPRSEQNAMGRVLMIVLAVALLAGLVFIGLLSRLGSQSNVENYLFDQKTHQKIIINDNQGSIHVHSQSKGPFVFRVTKHSEGMGLGSVGMEVSFNQYGPTISVLAQVQADPIFVGSRGIDIDVSVPSTASLEVHSVNGNITLTNLDDQLLVQIGTGSIKLENSQGQMTLQADSGTISTTNVRGQLNITNHQGNVEAHRVALHGQSSINAGNGAIAFDGTLDRSGHYRFMTQNGPINLALPASSAFRLQIDEGSGPLHNQFGQLSRGTNPQAVIAVSTQHDIISLHETK
ncbi:DUF4097 family beta strand repeat-containing protein [Dictyobacter arantiisoli]|uniref:DUF4097 domain-containing protein n=1 Tax=Dictyobacter arantiisoli TaxID=2014874 RepID=A0A5A5T9Z1_9CHLR|nr:DUF4097 family beta strand repeat-containing protein [Dictyobacter arantiisoli]GCF08330.1 hypothetical protein KDI_18940 [Dictyobacter arantiisoli]